jgi:hypothetical protein
MCQQETLVRFFQGHAAAAPPSSVMNARCFIRSLAIGVGQMMAKKSRNGRAVAFAAG